MTSAKKLAHDPLHKTVLGSNALRGGNKLYTRGVLGGCENWFEARLEPQYQKEDLQRKRHLRKTADIYYKPTFGEISDSFTTDAITQFNLSGRNDPQLLTNRNTKNPITSFVPPDPEFGHPPPGKWDTMYDLTLGLHPCWKEKPINVDQSGDYLHYQKYDADDHWRTTHMTDYRYQRPLKEIQPGAGDPSIRIPLPNRADDLDPFRPCFLNDTHIRNKYDRSAQTEHTSEFPPLQPELLDSERDALQEHTEDVTIPLQPTWLTGATGRGVKPFYSSYMKPPCWPPPWRNEMAARELEESANRPAAIQDLLDLAAKKRAAGQATNLTFEGSPTPSTSQIEELEVIAPEMKAKSHPPVYGYTGHRYKTGIFPKPPVTKGFLSLDTFTR